MTILALCLLCIAAGAVIAAQARRLHEADDYIAALNEALEEAHREVVMHREHIKALGASE
jgi:hypothetical protein